MVTTSTSTRKRVRRSRRSSPPTRRVTSDRVGVDEHRARPLRRDVILLHGFGQRYDLPIGLALYLFAAGGVVVISFVLVVLFAGEQVGAKAIEYPRRAVPWLVGVARSPWPRVIGGTIGVLGLLTVVIAGFFGPTNAFYNPAEYVVWIYFWALTVILSGLVGNLWYLLNPWAAIYDVVARLVPVRPPWKLPEVGVWPATFAYLAFACLELTSGMGSRPQIVAVAALTYSVGTFARMFLFRRDAWLWRCGAVTGFFCILGPVRAVGCPRDARGANPSRD